MEAMETVLPYAEIPEVTRDYADFICNVADLGEGIEKLYSLEDRRVEMHMKMVREYGLRYEFTRTAVCITRPEILKYGAERLAQIIDANLRYVKNTLPESRIREGGEK